MKTRAVGFMLVVILGQIGFGGMHDINDSDDQAGGRWVKGVQAQENNETQNITLETTVLLDFVWLAWVAFVVLIMLLREAGMRVMIATIGFGIFALPMPEHWKFILGFAQTGFFFFLAAQYNESRK